MFFKKKGERVNKLLVKVNEVYVATCTFKASINEGKGFYENKVTLFYLVTKSQYGFKELFTGRELYMDEDEELWGVSCIQKVEPLGEYLGDKKQEITYSALFDIIATINAMEKLENSKKGRKKQ